LKSREAITAFFIKEGKTIGLSRKPFPSTSKALVKAQKLMDKQEFSAAAVILTTCYQLRKNFKTNYLLFWCLLKLKNYQAAVETATDFLASYIENDDYLMNLFSAMGQAAMFIKMRELYLYLNDYMDAAEKKFFKAQIIQTEKKVDQQFCRQIQRKVASMAFSPTAQQKKLVQELYKLPLTEFCSLARDLLLQPAVHPLIKNDILDNLRRLKIQKQIQIFFLDGKVYALIPQKLHDFQSSKIKIKFEKFFANASDQVLGTAQANEVFLKLQLLYPFENKIVDQVASWLPVLIGAKAELLNAKQLKWHQLLERWLQQWQV
jgi:hypothetical protein